MLEKVYKGLKDTYACTFSSDLDAIYINVGFGLVINITHETRNGLNIFKIVSDRGSRPVYIGCPIDDNGHSDIAPLYCFIEDFASLL